MKKNTRFAQLSKELDDLTSLSLKEKAEQLGRMTMRDIDAALSRIRVTGATPDTFVMNHPIAAKIVSGMLPKFAQERGIVRVRPLYENLTRESSEGEIISELGRRINLLQSIQQR